MVEELILNSFAHFGDGNSCLILRRKKYRGEDGITYWEFVFRPNARIIAMYNLKDEINQIDGSVVKTYPATEIQVPDENPNHLRVWIFTDFDGNATPVSRIDDDKDLQILNLQKKFATMELENAELHEMLKKRVSPDIYIKQASDLIKEARSAASKKLISEEAEDEDEE